MASQQVYHHYAQNKGTLVPGQSIAVNKFTVQVDRYLAQGGFAHVYLVRTATPVYNTTHHVLKRIAVSNETMLTEVKKEVDIMRLLKGHPNIVNLIDAAWHQMPNGLYEVFILMEYCAGGGLIDMMNRRLRERLTEAEILQIFVDVCEAVAYMHNSRPPLLHRDLKVENILQSSPTSFKLCDFGSATTVASRPPATTQEIQALAAEVTRHTTLQYRAPEMVDSYLRRPIDEKSDVWALGVLLYKLCYYTTPFEEHGPLAILNVQYRIPPYPKYSDQMNSLIGSMLQEHGVQRPSVFELLTRIHNLRGTKSQFQYPVPVQQPLSPRHDSRTNPLGTTIPYRSAQLVAPNAKDLNSTPLSSSPAKNAGVQAREKVLEAIAPMRRGRPTAFSNKNLEPHSRSTSPPMEIKLTQKPVSDGAKNWPEGKFDVEQDEAWKAVTVKKGAGERRGALEDAWNVGARDNKTEVEKKVPGFGDDFAQKLWSSIDPNGKIDGGTNSSVSSSAPAKATVVPFRTPAFTGTDAFRGKQPAAVRVKDKDAFEGLGLASPSNDKSAPTLAEARKLRTGLATMSSASVNGYNRHDSSKPSSTAIRPSPSPRPTYLSPSQSQPQSLSPAPLGSFSSGSSWGTLSSSASRPNPSVQLDGLPAEARFPTLEELDATFGPSTVDFSYTPGSDTNSRGRSTSQAPTGLQVEQGKSPRLPPRPSNIGSSGTGGLLRPVTQLQSSFGHGRDGIRSQQVTGVAMRESRAGNSGSNDKLGGDTNTRQREKAESRDGSSSGAQLNGVDNSILTSRPPLSRKHRSSISIKHASNSSIMNDPSTASPSRTATSGRSSRVAPKDWLTGDDDNNHPTTTSASVSSPTKMPIIRDSPGKRASVIERNDIPIQQAVKAQQDLIPSPRPPLSSPVKSTVIASSPMSTPRAARVFPPVSVDVTAAAQKEASEVLADNWSPVAMSTRFSRQQSEVDSPSSADEGPEDPSGYVPATTKQTEKSRTKRKGRQSSVHDLVDLWGGGVAAIAGTKEKESELVMATTLSTALPKSAGEVIKGQTRRSTILPLHSSRANPGSSSPQPRPSPSRDSDRNDQRPNAGPDLHSKQPSSGGPRSPVSGHSRPQSMFVFPSSKSYNDSSAPSSAGLSSPELASGLSPIEEPNPRANIRRVSISDIVQRYEAISGKNKPGSGPPPAVLSKPAGLKVTAQTTESKRYSRGQKTSPEALKSNGGVTSLPVAHNHLAQTGEAANNRISPNGLSRISPGLPSTPNGPSRSPVVGIPDGEKSKQETSRPPRALFNPDNHSKSESNIGFPPSRLTTSTDSSSRSGDEQPSSPERPYQGVSKLIDQWQRKTAEANSPKNPRESRRSGTASKVGEPRGK